MRRRDFIAGLGSAVILPRAASAQQPAMPVVGFFFSGSPEPAQLAEFSKGLSEMGFVEGRNVAIEYRFGRNDPSRTSDLIADCTAARF